MAHKQQETKPINCLSFQAEFNSVQYYHKDDVDILISPDKTHVKPFMITHSHIPLIIMTEFATRPKSVSFCGSYVETWMFTLN